MNIGTWLTSAILIIGLVMSQVPPIIINPRLLEKIDEIVTSDLSIEKAVSIIRGPKGTTVVLTIFRDNEKEPKDLVTALKEKEEKLLQTDIAVVQGKLKNVHGKRKILKDIARIKTALRSKEVRN